MWTYTKLFSKSCKRNPGEKLNTEQLFWQSHSPFVTKCKIIAYTCVVGTSPADDSVTGWSEGAVLRQISVYRVDVSVLHGSRLGARVEQVLYVELTQWDLLLADDAKYVRMVRFRKSAFSLLLLSQNQSTVGLWKCRLLDFQLGASQNISQSVGGGDCQTHSLRWNRKCARLSVNNFFLSSTQYWEGKRWIMLTPLRFLFCCSILKKISISFARWKNTTLIMVHYISFWFCTIVWLETIVDKSRWLLKSRIET